MVANALFSLLDALFFLAGGIEVFKAESRLENRADVEKEIDEIKRLAETEKSIDRIYELELKDKAGIVHALIEKTLYISKKR